VPPSRRRIVVRQLVAVLAVAVAVGVAVALLSGGDEKPKTTRALPAASGNGADGPASRVSFLQRLIPPPPDEVEGPVAPRSVTDLAKRLPLDRAVAQLFVFGFTGKDATAPIFEVLARLDVGGVFVDGRNYDNAQQLAGLTGELSATATGAGHLPIWVFAEQDGGDYSQFPDLPPPLAPGDHADVEAASAALTETATTLKALGVNGLFAPGLDVGPDDGALGPLALSDDPDRVAAYARQSVASCRQLKLLCAAKHFPGIGAADNPTDEGSAYVGLSLEQLLERDVVPFAAAIEARIPAIVVGEGLYEPDDFVTPAALSEAIIGDLLRDRLSFGGVAITDDLADPAVSSFAPVPDAAVQAIQAGADMVFVSGELGDQEAAYAAVLNATRKGTIPEARIRQALLRVLLTKRAHELLVTDAPAGVAPQSSG
jgi:beta-N-acetylhexosaminidase